MEKHAEFVEQLVEHVADTVGGYESAQNALLQFNAEIEVAFNRKLIIKLEEKTDD